ncbi:polyphosphate polymerase domain-containing protein [Rhodopirellula sp. JC740]|uniref:Polyphosphate polymerase domain-containing protein n=1 Tax=Rhodopirellula halodulae TaxID=2894198 RepID=A0ABS8NGX0_9BACT|nr:polyphosphate polymerase domain-containing protein [Rhodopirellula sp. JC740]MCC9642807.1 polyphosphate polymerase domain-containing protein [Rhodopirellula sp. JC740]
MKSNALVLHPHGAPSAGSAEAFVCINHLASSVMKDKRIELKYQLEPCLAADVKQWAREHLAADPHCDSGDTYDVNTLYLDSPDLDLFHETGVVGKKKYRIRRYGSESKLWLESKRKKKCEVNKTRVVGDETEIRNQLEHRLNTERPCRLLSIEDSSSEEWFGDWFIAKTQLHRLQPTTQVHYQRFARMADASGQNIRLTIDSHLHASPARGWQVAREDDAHERAHRVQATEYEILELKFHRYMPHVFKELLRTFPIPVTGFSKYRAAVRCWNLDQAVPVCEAPAELSSRSERLLYA